MPSEVWHLLINAIYSYLLIGIKQQLAKCASSQLVVGGSIVSTPKYVRDLGVYLDSCLTMEQHVKTEMQGSLRTAP